MIGRNASKYVLDGKIWEVAGFAAAATSPERYHLHHKLGALCDYSREELELRCLYFNRPPYELEFLSPGEHARVHAACADPHVREGLRRIEMQKWYAVGIPLDVLLLDSKGCKDLNERTDRWEAARVEDFDSE